MHEVSGDWIHVIGSGQCTLRTKAEAWHMNTAAANEDPWNYPPLCLSGWAGLPLSSSSKDKIDQQQHLQACFPAHTASHSCTQLHDNQLPKTSNLQLIVNSISSIPSNPAFCSSSSSHPPTSLPLSTLPHKRISPKLAC
jgi:hypothetical protein